MARKRRTSASQILGAMEFSPIRTLVRQAKALEKNDPHSKELRSLCVELLQYELPKLKAVDHDIAADSNITVTIGGKPASPERGNE